jgi:hypothetical protein
MKFRNDALMLAGAFAFLLCGCEEEPRVVVEPTPTPAPVAVATPPPPAATPVNAKKGLYLKNRISITNDTGIFGFAPGTELEIVSRNDDTLVVLAKGMQIEVKESDTTENFADVAGAVQASGVAIKAQQAATAARIEERKQQNAAAAQSSELAQRQKRIEEINRQIVALDERRKAASRQVYSSGRDPNKTPEGRARLAEIQRMDDVIAQLRAHAAQLRRMK